MQLTSHDLQILHLASTDAEGRLTFRIAEDGSIALQGKGSPGALAAEGSLPKLEEMGLLDREVSRSYALTETGWAVVKAGREQSSTRP